ncbi:MAG: DUF6541 family protein [Candidatus Micrarchaeia archaeon]
MVLELLPSLAWLAVVSFAMGYGLIREKSLMSLAFGLSAFAVLSVVFNLAHVPLHWAVFLILSVAILVYLLLRKELSFDIGKPDLALALVILIALLNLLIYVSGSNAYPYLEDDDPWVHAVGAKWVAQTMSYSRFFDGAVFTRLYIEPYPPAYDILMGVLNQMTGSVVDTLKFYNALLIAFTLLCAFYAFSEMTGNRNLSLLAVFFLACLPSFMSHFIWAQTLALMFMFCALYAYERAMKDRRFIIPAGTAAAAVAVTQPSVAAVFAFISLLYFAVKLHSLGKDAVRPLLIAGAIAIALSSVYYLPTLVKYGPKYTALGIGMLGNMFGSGSTDDTSGGVVYGLTDFIFAEPTGKIDQQIGIGIALSVAAAAGLVLAVKERHSWKSEPWLVLSVILLVFCLLGTEGNALPFKLFPHRFWVFLSVPVALLSAYAILRIDAMMPQKNVLLGMMVVAVLLTSADAKIKVQTSQWPAGASFTSNEEIAGYLQMKATLPKGTLVFPLCSDDSKVIGSDMLSEPYVPEYELFKRTAPDRSTEEIYAFLKGRNYSYLTIDSTCYSALGSERTARLVSGLESSPRFDAAFVNGGFALLKLR